MGLGLGGWRELSRPDQIHSVRGGGSYLVLVVPRSIEGRGGVLQPHWRPPVDDLLSQPHQADERTQRARHHEAALQTVRQ